MCPLWVHFIVYLFVTEKEDEQVGGGGGWWGLVVAGMPQRRDFPLDKAAAMCYNLGEVKRYGKWFDDLRLPL